MSGSRGELKWFKIVSVRRQCSVDGPRYADTIILYYEYYSRGMGYCE